MNSFQKAISCCEVLCRTCQESYDASEKLTRRSPIIRGKTHSNANRRKRVIRRFFESARVRRAFQSHCPHHRKRESLRDVTDCETLRSSTPSLIAFGSP